MSLYESYLKEIEERKGMGLNPKPIDDEALANEVIFQIKDSKNKYRDEYALCVVLFRLTYALINNSSINSWIIDG